VSGAGKTKKEGAKKNLTGWTGCSGWGKEEEWISHREHKEHRDGKEGENERKRTCGAGKQLKTQKFGLKTRFVPFSSSGGAAHFSPFYVFFVLFVANFLLLSCFS